MLLSATAMGARFGVGVVGVVVGVVGVVVLVVVVVVVVVIVIVVEGGGGGIVVVGGGIVEVVDTVVGDGRPVPGCRRASVLEQDVVSMHIHRV